MKTFEQMARDFLEHHERQTAMGELMELFETCHLEGYAQGRSDGVVEGRAEAIEKMENAIKDIERKRT